MGQLLSLPQKIPSPNQECREEMIKNGFQFSYGDEGKDFISYQLPKGWKIVNHSWTQDLPEWYFLDSENMKRFIIFGSPKETYDSKLKINIIKNPEIYQTRETEALHCETSVSNLLTKAIEKNSISK